MGDDGFFEDKEEIAKSVLKHQQADIKSKFDDQDQEDYMETIFDFHKFTADPSLKRISPKLRDINKNWVLGNYKPKDETVILMCESLISDVDYLLPNATNNNLIRTAIHRDIFSRITISRGRKGFAAKLFVTQIGSTKAEISGLNNKKSGLFSLRKR